MPFDTVAKPQDPIQLLDKGASLLLCQNPPIWVTRQGLVQQTEARLGLRSLL